MRSTRVHADRGRSGPRESRLQTLPRTLPLYASGNKKSPIWRYEQQFRAKAKIKGKSGSHFGSFTTRGPVGNLGATSTDFGEPRKKSAPKPSIIERKHCKLSYFVKHLVGLRQPLGSRSWRDTDGRTGSTRHRSA